MQVDHVMMQGGGDLSNILYVPGGGGPPDLVGCGFPRFENLRFDDDPAGQYGGQVTPDSILEDPMLQHGVLERRRRRRRILPSDRPLARQPAEGRAP
jgi:hypothetical protein